MSVSMAPIAVADEIRTNGRRQFQAGVRPYADDYYVPDYVPSDTDLLCAFRIEPAAGVDMIEASAAVAAESSTGTWTEVWSNQLTDLDFYKAKVYRIEDDIAYIAYPMDLFEENSVVNIMSSIVGNVFGFKAVSALRLEDMRIPVALVKTFSGPQHRHLRRAGAAEQVGPAAAGRHGQTQAGPERQGLLRRSSTNAWSAGWTRPRTTRT